MMTEPAAPPLPKWPFLAGDVLLVAVAAWIAFNSPAPFEPTPLLLVFGCIFSGAWIAVMPFLAEHKTRLKVAETTSLGEAIQKINELKSIAERVAGATGQWQDIHAKSTEAMATADAMARRMESEAQAFAEFMEKADQSEKAHLRLEVDKLRRAERDWVQVLMTLLDHVHALHTAAVRSGKRPLIQQISQFQHACRDVGRRVGLIPFEVELGSPFDKEQHFHPDGEKDPPSGATVSETLAPGYQFQGRLLRKPLVQWTVVQDQAISDAEPEPMEGDLFQTGTADPPEPPSIEDATSSESPASSQR